MCQVIKSFFVPSTITPVELYDKFKSILKQQFELVYYGKFDYQAIETMSVIEREILYDILKEVKKKESDSRIAAIKGRNKGGATAGG